MTPPDQSESSAKTERLTRAERIGFKALGVPTIVIGLVFLGLDCWVTYGQWIRVTQWPRTNATLISKDISSVGARLVFHYEVGGRRFTGRGFRWGSEKTVRAALESYEPGTMQRISYDPKDSGQVETNLDYSLELLKGPIVFAAFGMSLIAGGVTVYRWSYGIAGRISDENSPAKISN